MLQLHPLSLLQGTAGVPGVDAHEVAPVEPITDFDRYMLGDLPGPGTLARDPFSDTRRPTVRAPRSAAPAPDLRGIVRADGRLVALFDRGTAGQGESVAGWTVHSIDERSVTLQRNGRTVRRSL